MSMRKTVKEKLNWNITITTIMLCIAYKHSHPKPMVSFVIMHESM